MYTIEALQFDGRTWLNIWPDNRAYASYSDAHDVMTKRGGYRRGTVKYRIVKN